MSVRVSRINDEVHGLCAAVDIPTEGGAIRVVGVGGFLSGLRDAASIASSIANNPVLSAVLPPGTGAALKAINDVANHPHPAKAAAQFGGPGGKRLAAAIKADAKGGPGRYYTLPDIKRKA
jgi:hypothetical protein